MLKIVLLVRKDVTTEPTSDLISRPLEGGAHHLLVLDEVEIYVCSCGEAIYDTTKYDTTKYEVLHMAI